MIGRFSPFMRRTDSSVFTPTISASPSAFDFARYSIWPRWRISKHPLVNTTFLCCWRNRSRMDISSSKLTTVPIGGLSSLMIHVNGNRGAKLPGIYGDDSDVPADNSACEICKGCRLPDGCTSDERHGECRDNRVTRPRDILYILCAGRHAGDCSVRSEQRHALLAERQKDVLAVQ